MTLGSSESFGYAEPAGQEYPAQLADSLSSSGCYQVMNAAIVGIAVPAMQQLFERWGSRFHPDVVVILANPLSYVGNEPPLPPKPVASTGTPAPRPFGQRLRPRFPGKLRDLVQYPAFIQRRRIERMVETLVSGRTPEWFFRDIPLDRLAMYRRDVDSLVMSVRRSGAKPLLVVHPLRYLRIDEPGASTELQAMRQFSARALPETVFRFDSAGAEVVRVLAAARGVSLADVPSRMNGHHELFADLVHYTPAGAAVLAGEVARVIRTP